MGQLREYAGNGGIVIVITHDLSLIRDVDKSVTIQQVREEAYA
jgi:ABC-type lipoprotein export system ATPase subunit